MSMILIGTQTQRLFVQIVGDVSQQWKNIKRKIIDGDNPTN